MVWTAGAQNLSGCCQLGLEIQKSGVSQFPHTKSVGISVATYPVLHALHISREFPKLVNVKMLFKMNCAVVLAPILVCMAAGLGPPSCSSCL